MSEYSLFSVIGIEIEYMLVDKDTLNVQPKSDKILKMAAYSGVGDEDISLSNELVMHVIELKNNGPRPLSTPLSQQFQKTITDLQPLLDEENLMLLPTGAHPWMDPLKETERWPHGHHEIYQQYDKIFDCSGHGWSNLQSMHVNLPFADEEEFYQLHNAIRLLLPLLPAIAASTPFLDGRYTGIQDSRLYFYGKNQERIPSISGEVIPEFIRSSEEYRNTILQPMYDDIRPLDPAGILQHEWLNSRAAMPKFDCKAIEIRIIDSQECVDADIAIARVITAVLQNWLEHSHYFLDTPCDITRLKSLYDQTIVHGLAVQIHDQELSAQWQLSRQPKNCRDVWSQLIENVSTRLDQPTQCALETILSQGNLSERLLRACGSDYQQDSLIKVYRSLNECLRNNHQFK